MNNMKFVVDVAVIGVGLLLVLGDCLSFDGGKRLLSKKSKRSTGLKCPPGKFLYGSKQEKYCMDCPKGQFNMYYDNSTSCEDCEYSADNLPPHTYIEKNCTPTNDIKLRCKDGYVYKNVGDGETHCIQVKDHVSRPMSTTTERPITETTTSSNSGSKGLDLSPVMISVLVSFYSLSNILLLL